MGFHLMTASQQAGESRPLISAHEGGSEHARRGTYEAYEQVAATGAEYVEFDIRRTRDEVMVVHHDPWAGTSGPLVAGLTYAELCDVAGYQVPLVQDVMELLAGRAAGHLDLKETGYEDEVIKLAVACFGPDDFVATTLEDASIATIKSSFPEVRTALSLGRDRREIARSRWLGVRVSELFPLSRIRRCGADWVAVNYQLAWLGVLRACEQHGIGAMVWTVDSDALIDEFLADQRVDVLITNRPQHAVTRRATLAR
jgi:glycerophosphoryl diester phosphodiesterase